MFTEVKDTLSLLSNNITYRRKKHCSLENYSNILTTENEKNQLTILINFCYFFLKELSRKWDKSNIWFDSFCRGGTLHLALLMLYFCFTVYFGNATLQLSLHGKFTWLFMLSLVRKYYHWVNIQYLLSFYLFIRFLRRRFCSKILK